MEKRDIYSPVRKEQVMANTSKYLIFTKFSQEYFRYINCILRIDCKQTT